MFKRILFAMVLCASLAQAESVEQAIRGYLLAAEDAPPKITKPCVATGSLGLLVTENGDSIAGTLTLHATREWDLNTLKFNVRSTFQQANSVTTQSEHIFTQRYERRLTQKSALFQNLLLENDQNEQLNLRSLLAGGYRRLLVEKEKFVMSGDAGAGWQYDKYYTRTENNAVGQFGLDWEWKLTKSLTYKQTILYTPMLTDFPEFRFIWKSTFITPISEALNLELTILDQYNSDPQPGISNNDIQVSLSIAVRFTKEPKKDA